MCRSDAMTRNPGSGISGSWCTQKLCVRLMKSPGTNIDRLLIAQPIQSRSHSFPRKSLVFIIFFGSTITAQIRGYPSLVVRTSPFDTDWRPAVRGWSDSQPIPHSGIRLTLLHTPHTRAARRRNAPVRRGRWSGRSGGPCRFCSTRLRVRMKRCTISY